MKAALDNIEIILRQFTLESCAKCRFSSIMKTDTSTKGRLKDQKIKYKLPQI